MFRLSSLGHHQIISLYRGNYTIYYMIQYGKLNYYYYYYYSKRSVDKNEISLNNNNNNNNDLISHIISFHILYRFLDKTYELMMV